MTHQDCCADVSGAARSFRQRVKCFNCFSNSAEASSIRGKRRVKLF